MPNLTGVVHVAAGDGHSCALLNNGTARCWGSNSHGQLGDGTKVDHVTPAVVTGLSGIGQLVAGYMETCAILTADNSLYCWGSVNPNGSTNDDIPTATRKIF